MDCFKPAHVVQDEPVELAWPQSGKLGLRKAVGSEVEQC